MLLLGESTSGSITGSFSVAAGATLGLAGVNIATAANSGAGTVRLSGTVTDTAALHVANVTLAGGTTTVDAPLGLSGTLSIQSGTMDLTTAAATSSVGAFSMSAGQLGSIIDDQASLTDTGTFSWTGGEFLAPNGQPGGVPVLDQTTPAAASIVGPSFSNVTQWDLAIDGPLALSGSVGFQAGGGITESGVATISDNSGVADQGAGGPFAITGGGTLTKLTTGGTASVSVPVVNAGTVRAGGGILAMASLTNNGTLDLATGIVKLASSYTPPAGSAVAVTLGGPTAGTGYGQLQVTGTAALAGALDVTTATGFVPKFGQTFAVTTSTGATSGGFAPIVQSYSSNGLAYVEAVTAAGMTLTATNPISPSSLPGGTVNSPYSQALSAIGGIGAETWSIASGAVPAGLSLAPSTGVISGTPTAGGTASFSVEVTDSATPPGHATQAYSIVVGMAIIPPSLLAATAGSAYSAALTPLGGTAPYAWTVTSGTLPKGLSLSSAGGVISGTPTVAGTSSFTVMVTDHSSPTRSGTRTYSLVVSLGITPASLPATTYKVLYTVTLAASGGISPYTWKLVSGTLPAGLSLSGTKGTISGTPTKAGTSKFTVEATDHGSPARTGMRAYTLVVALAIAPASLPAATIKVAYTVTLTASGGASPYTWKLLSGTLPAGLSLSGTKGVISGTPTKAGTSFFTVEAIDHSSPVATGTKVYSLLVKT